MNNYPNYYFGKNNEYEIVIANTIKLKTTAWNLVYQNYEKHGYAKDEKNQLWYSIYDAMPSTTTFLALKNGVPMATVSIVFDSNLGLPSDTLFSNELNQMRKEGKHPFEITSLASNCTGLKEATDVLMHMFMLAHITARYKNNATEWVIMVNPKHADFYKKLMFFEQVGDQKVYEKVGGVPTVLLTIGNEMSREKFIMKNSAKAFASFVIDPVKEHRIFRFLRRNIKTLKWENIKKYFQNEKHLLSELPKDVFKILAIYTNSARQYTNTLKFEG